MEINYNVVMVGFFAAMNMALNTAMIIYLYKINSGIRKTLNHHIDFADAMVRIDDVAKENALHIDNRMSENTKSVHDKMDYLTKWHRASAKMMEENLNTLKSHDSKVSNISGVINKIADKVEKVEGKIQSKE